MNQREVDCIVAAMGELLRGQARCLHAAASHWEAAWRAKDAALMAHHGAEADRLREQQRGAYLMAQKILREVGGCSDAEIADAIGAAYLGVSTEVYDALYAESARANPLS